jgi:anaerobic selenocysteine-containing dehydrogenase
MEVTVKINPDIHAEAKSKGWNPKQWVSLVPYGANQTHPNAYKDILRCAVQNRDNLGYAWRILRDGCCDGCAFTPVALPEERVPEGLFLLTTRRGRQFNNMVLDQNDPITGARRDDIIMSKEDAERLGLRNGDSITLPNQLGVLHGRVKIDRIKPGCLQVHWPEANVIIPAGRLDPSGIPDYNTVVEVIRARAAPAAAS